MTVLLSVAAIGGDHFEYRMLDVVFPPVFVLLAEGCAALVETRYGGPLASGAVALVVWGLVYVPWRSHAEFPKRYISGFPGASEEGAAFLDPDRDALFRLPGLRAIGTAHRNLTLFLTKHFIAIRQEEHALFLDKAKRQGMRLRTLVDGGVLPRDTRIAIDCVGAIPYYSNLIVLDRHGLTDAAIARRPTDLPGLFAHEKFADLLDAQRFRVELWAFDPVDLVVPITSERMLWAMTHPPADGDYIVYAAPVGVGEFALCTLPQGVSRTEARIPRLRFTQVTDTVFERAYLADAAPAFRDLIRKNPDDLSAINCLAFLMVVQGRTREALDLYVSLSRLRPDDVENWDRIANGSHSLGEAKLEGGALKRVADLSRRGGDDSRASDAEARLRLLGVR